MGGGVRDGVPRRRLDLREIGVRGIPCAWNLFLLLVSPRTMTSLQLIMRGVLSVDIADLEKAEQQIDQFIERRAREAKDANAIRGRG